jgi:hypothetical protein
VQIDIKLHAWFIVLLPLAAGTLLAAVAGLLWATKGRFSLGSLFLGMTFLGLVIGPLSVIWPRLHHPRFLFVPEQGFGSFEQQGEPASRSSYRLLMPWTLAIGIAPLLVLPVVVLWPARSDRRITR